jgi:hypothetical protein
MILITAKNLNAVLALHFNYQENTRVNFIISFCTAPYICSWKPQNKLLEVMCKELP